MSIKFKYGGFSFDFVKSFKSLETFLEYGEFKFSWVADAERVEMLTEIYERVNPKKAEEKPPKKEKRSATDKTEE